MGNPLFSRIAEAFSDLRPFSLGECRALLTAPAEAAEEIFAAARAVRERVFGRRIGLFAPLYYSNVCANDCLYCGFRRSLGSARRRILAPGEVAAEAAALFAQGHRRILLIASEDPTPRGLALAVSAVRAVHEAAAQVLSPRERDAVTLAVEMAPRPQADFARLAEAGVSGYILFQETYDRAAYPTVHPAGPKADFDARIAGPRAAAAGGIRDLGLGVLFGLSDPLTDTLAMISHARELGAATGRPVATVSVPRLEPAEGVPFTEKPPYPLDDALWLRIVAVLRLALPWSDVIVSTREPEPLRRASLRAGASVFSAGSRTDPGGYVHPGEALGQFRIGDPRSLEEVKADLIRRGFIPETAARDRRDHAGDRRDHDRDRRDQARDRRDQARDRRDHGGS